MATYLDGNIICVKDGGDGFSIGSVYELLEVDGLYVTENEKGQRLEAFLGKTNVAAGNSVFERWFEN